MTAEIGEHERAPPVCESRSTSLRATLRAPPSKWAIRAFFPAGERSELSRREAWPQWGLGRSPKRPAGRVGGEQSDRQGAMRHRTPRARGQPEGLPQAEAWAERERVPSGHNCRRQLATGRPEQIQEPGTAVPGTPIFANNAKRGGPPLESPCRVLSLVLSFAPKESTALLGAADPPSAPESARQSPPRKGVCANGRTKGLSARPLETFGHRSWRETHDGKAQSVPGRYVRHPVSAARTAARSACCLPKLLRFAL